MSQKTLMVKYERLKTEYQTIIDNIALALFPNSPIENARAEFCLDGMGAVQVIKRLREENARLKEAYAKCISAYSSGNNCDNAIQLEKEFL